MRIAAAQTPEFREDLPAALAYLAEVMAQAHREHAALLCLPEAFLQGYLTDADAARRHALDLASPLFANLLAQLPEHAPATVVGLIEAGGDTLATALSSNGPIGYCGNRQHAKDDCGIGVRADPVEDEPGIGGRQAQNDGDGLYPNMHRTIPNQGVTRLCPNNRRLRQCSQRINLGGGSEAGNTPAEFSSPS